MNISQISPWNFLFFSNEVPGRSRGGMALQIPARSGPGTRGEVRGKKEEAPAHLLVVLDRWKTAVDRERRRRFNGGDVL